MGPELESSACVNNELDSVTVDSLSLTPPSAMLGLKSVRCKTCQPRINRTLCSVIYFGTSERNSGCIKESHDEYCNFS